MIMQYLFDYNIIYIEVIYNVKRAVYTSGENKASSGTKGYYTIITCKIFGNFPFRRKCLGNGLIYSVYAIYCRTFNVSTDYLLGMDETSTISVKGLSVKQVAVVMDIIQCFKNPDK